MTHWNGAFSDRLRLKVEEAYAKALKTFRKCLSSADRCLAASMKEEIINLPRRCFRRTFPEHTLLSKLSGKTSRLVFFFGRIISVDKKSLFYLPTNSLTGCLEHRGKPSARLNVKTAPARYEQESSCTCSSNSQSVLISINQVAGSFDEASTATRVLIPRADNARVTECLRSNSQIMVIPARYNQTGA